jgi:hypothetical protein
VHVIDPPRTKVVGIIEGIEVNHGVGAAPDGSPHLHQRRGREHTRRRRCEDAEGDEEGEVERPPNNMAVGKDGKRVYVGIIQEPGGVDVIDTATLTRVKTIPTKGRSTTPTSRLTASTSSPGRSSARA